MAYSLKNFKYHEYISKTNFSFLIGASHPSEIVTRSALYGYSSISINDFDGVYGIARAYNDKKHLLKSNNIKIDLNYGAEIHLAKNHNLPILKQNSIVLNVKSLEGYKNLCKILSFSHLESKDEAFITLHELSNFSLKGIFAVVPMRGALSEFNKKKSDLIFLKSLFGKNLYLAVTKTFNNADDSKILISNNLSKEFEIDQIISQDAFYSNRREKSFHDLITAIKHNLTVSEALAYYFPNGERSLHTLKEIYKAYKSFKNFDKMIFLSEELNEKSSFCLSELKYNYPKEMIPIGFTAQQYLEKVTWDGAKKVYKSSIPEKIVHNISRELDLIEDLNFADYFLTVWDIVSWARSKKILCQGRGSAANSAVCFSLGITSCDPSLFDLLFERFISKERGDPPDIDIDFEHERREEVIQYIYKRYGRNKAAMVANIITFRSKGATRAVGKALGLDEKTLKLTSNLMGTVLHRKDDINVVLNEIHKVLKSVVPDNFPWNFWSEFSTKLKGYPRHMGLHSGGFIISQNPIDELVPQEPASMDGRTIIQWAKDDIEELGFFKIDILALGMLTAVRKCFEYVNQSFDKNLSLYDLPQDDGPTYSMIQKANTVGVFQIESRAQMSMLPRLKPKNFYDLVIEIALIRPGPIQGNAIHPYLKRRDGLVPIDYPHEKTKSILTKTLGIIIFQEQLMRIAIELGNFTPGEANELRKQVGTWNSKTFSRNLTPYISKLLDGLKKNGVTKQFMVQMVDQMKGFAHYGFPESHAISFAHIAYASCYLKCHYPSAFYTSVLNSQPMGFYSPHDLLQTAKQEGVKILPISVNDSDWDHKLELLDQKKGRPKVYGIRLGFRIVTSLSHTAVKVIENFRKTEGKWKSFDNFINTVRINRDDYSSIAAANGFKCFGLDRIDAIWRAEAVPFKPMIDVSFEALNIRKKTEIEHAQMDLNSTGTTLGVHPVELIKTKSWMYKISVQSIVTSKELKSLSNFRYENNPKKIRNGNLINVFGLVRIKQAPATAKGMVFITIQDETGFINIAFTPQVYKKFYKLVETSGFLCVKGKLQNVMESHSILVSEVYLIDNQSIIRRNSKISKPESLSLKPRGYY